MIPLIFCIYFRKKLNTKALKVFFIYAVILFLFVGINFLALKVIKDQLIIFLVLRLFNIFEYSIIAIFLYHVLKLPLFKKIILFSIIPFIIYAVIDYLYNNPAQFNNHSNIVAALLIIIFIVFFFYEKMNSEEMTPLHQSIYFWIIVALMLYFSGSFFFFLFSNAGVDRNLMAIVYCLVVLLKDILLSVSLLASETDEYKSNILQIPTDINFDEPNQSTAKN